MSKSIELGGALLRHHKAQLDLELTASVTLSSRSGPTNVTHLSDAELLDSLMSRNSWVSRGSGLQLCIETRMDGEPMCQKKTERLTETLTNAHLWRQLNLQTSAAANCSTSEELESEGGMIQLSISHLRLSDDSQKRENHRLLAGVPFADVRPPEAVPVLALESISLALDIKRARTRRRQKRSKLPKRAVTGDDGAPALMHYTEPSGLFDLEYPAVLTEADLLFEYSHDTSTNPMIMSVNTEHTPTQTAFPGETRRGKRRMGHTDEHVLKEATEMKLQDITELVDTALRFTICSQPSRLPAHIKLTKHSLAGRLSDLFPALWSPGYLPAISQRACFLPVISRSLTQSVYKKSTSASLRSKVDGLRYATPGLRDSHETSDFPVMTQDCSGKAGSEVDTDKIVQGRLWDHTQHALFDKNAARHLRPLAQLDNLVGSVPDSDEILHHASPANPIGDPELWPMAETMAEEWAGCESDSDVELLMVSADGTWVHSSDDLLYDTENSCAAAWKDLDLFQHTGSAAGAEGYHQLKTESGRGVCDNIITPRTRGPAESIPQGFIPHITDEEDPEDMMLDA